ncbi:anti-sigma factor family protein [Halalkalibacter nanhaiisediminis]|uniref:Anti-sigma-W factor RsiW n=1 Tax=Halalkalibacter nanhaiisediminis TaxID=688079 RepID=A0A562QBM1_9BACI|nr:anti-sigma factor [Halalkalibacter nanhaiisediminis]TWI54124.1 anti-sigma factor RsiW [Halalkalibacter nanhaiisediminis]
MKCEQHYEELIQAFLDGEATEGEKEQLDAHLAHCPSCRQHFHELKKVIAFVQSSSHIEAPAGFTEGVMAKLPERKQASKWKQWTRQHPILIAAAIFILLMSASISSLWDNGDEQVVVTGSGQIVIDQETGKVLVPEGEVIEGDLIVRNGSLQVDGEVRGNVLLVNSEPYLASAGHVSGDIDEVNQVLEWVWYHIKGFFKDVVTIVED